jgi:hypothetical protein
LKLSIAFNASVFDEASMTILCPAPVNFLVIVDLYLAISSIMHTFASLGDMSGIVGLR